jgi:hypothetical protein
LDFVDAAWSIAQGDDFLTGLPLGQILPNLLHNTLGVHRNYLSSLLSMESVLVGRVPHLERGVNSLWRGQCPEVEYIVSGYIGIYRGRTLYSLYLYIMYNKADI